MNITRIQIKNYRAIAALDAQISPRGAIAKGGNARGKTTVLRAIRAALLARDVGPDSIREGADKAEIIVDVDDPAFRVKRHITKGASTVSVETSAQDVKRKPQTFLSDLLGTAPLDPLDLFLAKPAERKKLVLAAMPARVTSADFEAWIPEELRGVVPDHVREMLDKLHGVDACAALHKVFYDVRADANAAAKEAANTFAHLEKEHEAMPCQDAGAPTTAAAAEAYERARVAFVEINGRKLRVNDQERRFTGARETVRENRERAAALRRSAEGSEDRRQEQTALIEKITKLRAELAAAEQAHGKLVRVIESDDHAIRDAAILESRADELEKTIAAGAETPPTETELAIARADADFAAKVLEAAREKEALHAHAELVTDAKTKAETLATRAKALTEVVDRLRNDAPRELLAKSEGIRGLGIDGDTLTLDGKSIDAVSGNEQMFFAVEVARRANAKTKILVVDGLERLDPDALPFFINAATRDGFQLIATRVERGEMVLDAIEPLEESEAAE